MRFALRMAGRELRSSIRRLLPFFLAVGLGVAAIVVLRSAADSLKAALVGESRSLLAGDVRVSASEGFSENDLFILREKLGEHPVTGVARAAQVATLARSASDDGLGMMVELKGVDEGFPLHGVMEVEGAAYGPDLLEGRGALVRPEVLVRLGMGVGDRIVLGDQSFLVRGVLLREAGAGVDFFRRGPRVLVSHRDLMGSGLLDTPARGDHEMLFSLASEAAAMDFAWDLRGAFEDTGIRVRTLRETGDRLSRRIRRGEDYLSLAGFVILVLGAVGVFSVIRTFTVQNLRSAAIQRCLGVGAGTIFLTALLQVIALAGLASAFGIGLGAAALSLVPQVEMAGVQVAARLTPVAALQGALIGGAVSLLAAIVPLLPLRRVRPLGLLRSGDLLADGSSRERRVELAAGAAVLLAFLVLAGLQSGSLPIALAVSFGFLGVAVSLWLLASVLIRALHPLAASRSFAVRHALRTVRRGANQVRIILVALGVGVFLVAAVTGIESNLRREFSFQEDSLAPDLFFLDIQGDQVDAVRENARAGGRPDIRLIPVLQGRIHAVFGRDLRLEDREAVRSRGSLGREYTISARTTLDDNETLVDGAFWGDRPAEGIEVSAEIQMQREYGMQVGDVVRFRILGETLDARITSIRDVEWRNARNGGFTFLLHPDNVRDFPMTWAGFVRGPDGVAERARFQAAVIGAFPNVTVVDLRDVLNTMQQVADAVALAIRIVGLIAVIGGVLILVGSVAVHMGARRRETAVLRVLGAARSRVVALTLIEHGAIGTLAGAAAALFAAVVTLYVVREIMRVPFTAEPWIAVVAVAGAGLGAAVVGAFAAVDVLRRKPLGLLTD